VTFPPSESITIAVNAKLPVVGGVHEMLYGDVVSVPIDTPLAKNCTEVTVAPVLAKAVVVMVAGAPMVRFAPAAGLKILTLGTAAAAVTVTSGDST
jgi:hypothetical protein